MLKVFVAEWLLFRTYAPKVLVFYACRFNMLFPFVGWITVTNKYKRSEIQENLTTSLQCTIQNAKLSVMT